MNLRCSSCGRVYPIGSRKWCCDCGDAFELEGGARFSRQAMKSDESTLWRYRSMLPVRDDEHIVSLGEGFTPLVETEIYGLSILCKPEFMSPTGSFKDRGATVLVSVLREMGVNEVVEDSSGNAAASLAAYCAAAGIDARIFVPAHASPAKLNQITVYGAEVVVVDGSRGDVAMAAQDAALETYYASHNYSPFFLEGTKTFAYEVWEQLEDRVVDNLIVPVGNGSLLVGAYRGFVDLKEAGLIARMPRLFAVQSQACAPLLEGYQRGLENPPPIREGDTIAEGIRIARPVHGRESLRAVRETQGAIVAVEDAEIQEARSLLARKGLYVEPTSAAALAGLGRLCGEIGPRETTVVALTGSGLKGG